MGNIYCAMLQRPISKGQNEATCLAFIAPGMPEAEAWFMGWLAGAKIEYDPKNSLMDIFLYDGPGGVKEAGEYIADFIRTQTKALGGWAAEIYTGDDPEKAKQAAAAMDAEQQSHDEPLPNDLLFGIKELQERYDRGEISLEDVEKWVEDTFNDVFFKNAGHDEFNEPHTGECAMCGKARPLGTDGMCPSCSQIWNG